ncbi:unnamed protein product, partial [Meganyctiphanes norvegica]
TGVVSCFTGRGAFTTGGGVGSLGGGVGSLGGGVGSLGLGGGLGSLNGSGLGSLTGEASFWKASTAGAAEEGIKRGSETSVVWGAKKSSRSLDCTSLTLSSFLTGADIKSSILSSFWTGADMKSSIKSFAGGGAPCDRKSPIEGSAKGSLDPNGSELLLSFFSGLESPLRPEVKSDSRSMVAWPAAAMGSLDISWSASTFSKSRSVRESLFDPALAGTFSWVGSAAPPAGLPPLANCSKSDILLHYTNHSKGVTLSLCMVNTGATNCKCRITATHTTTQQVRQPLRALPP